MELRQLRYFLDIVDEGSFTRAARNAYVAQPGVSAQVRNLERELGVTLLDRTGKTVTPTRAGEAIIPHARAALRAVDQISGTASSLTGLLTGRLVLGTVPSISSRRISLPDALSRFHDDHPGVEITLTEGNSDSLMEDLRAGHVDLALLSLGTSEPRGIRTRTLAEEPVVAVVPDHPLADRDHVTLDELSGFPLVTFPQGSGVRDLLEDAASGRTLRLHIALEAGDPRIITRFAEAGLGAAVLPAPQLNATSGESPLVTVPVTGPTITGRIALAWRAGAEPGPARGGVPGLSPIAHSNQFWTLISTIAYTRRHGQTT